MNLSVGTIPVMIRNDEKVYLGDLRKYFSIVFINAQNLHNPYHNFRHMLHVTWLCYLACKYYADKLSPREMRNLLIAALFHDFDHSGMMGNDDLDIIRAIRGMRKYLLPEDRPFADEIAEVMQATEFPHKTPSEKLPLLQQIIRDADMAQSMSNAWIQHVIFGLALEWNKKPIDVLKAELPFHEMLKFYTDWGKSMFPQTVIDRKTKEVTDLIEILVEGAS